jgi:hypothetical protein
MQLRRLALTFTTLALTLAAGCAGQPGSGGAGGHGTDRPAPENPGKTSFTSEDQNNPGGFRAGGPAMGGAGTGGSGGASDNGAPPSPTAPGKGESAPGGRLGDVQEGDIYKVAGTNLYYLNTYKGFIVYDIANPQKPVRVSRLPVFGYPVEMFVEGTTIYALLSDSLYLTQTSGKLEFARHNVSQLVTIDITDPSKPRVLKTLDIVGQLREGVSRKIENTIYVVSYWNRNYWWGWSYEQADPARQDQAWVYSFDVSNRESPQKTGELKVFEGGAVNYYDRVSGASYSRNFSGVYIAATANALMVVENWYIHASGGNRPGQYGCGYYNSDQQAVVSIVDISDPKGAIRVHTKFETAGSLTDQFKQTYTHDPVTKKGTYYGIFARQGWSSSDCSGQQHIQNTIEAWDVSNGAAPARIGALDFGKKNETVRGTAFDVDRKVAFAITAEQIDPLYAIDIADPTKLRVLSMIDGLSGDISVFRTVGADKKFLLAVGRDNSKSCVGVDSSRGENNIAVSLIDARELTNIRLVQRQCVKIENAAWVGSEVTWNLDQAHKMLGMHADGNLNVITVPVSYYTRSDTKEGWWYERFQTAVGIMSWDLSRYDAAKAPAQQTVIQNHGTFIHPDGEVRRSVLFTHPTLQQRLMANLSDTHISLANIQDLMAPKLESIVEVAPYLSELFRFGDYIVEEVQPRVGNNWYWQRSAVEFRVKRAGGDLDGATPVATFMVGQVQTVIKHGDQLVIFRSFPETTPRGGVPVDGRQRAEAVVYDLSDPTKPRLAGRVDVPQEAFPYYTFYCGGYWDGFWWGGYGGYGYGGSSWVDTAHGLVVARQVWDTNYTVSKWKLLFLDLRDIAKPRVSDRDLNLGQNSFLTSMTVDTVDNSGFYLGSRTLVGEVTRTNGAKFYQWKDWAARFNLVGDQWSQVERMNIPGRLIRTWRNPARERMLITSDFVSEWREDPATKQSYWTSWSRLSLLREIAVGGQVAAELQDEKTFKDLNLASLTADGERLFVNGQPGFGYGGYRGGYPAGDIAVGPGGGPAAGPRPDLSDRLMAFDLSAKKLNLVYDQRTKMFNVQLMGVQEGRLFVNLAGDGILIVDVKDAAKPFGVLFSRTLGYATHIEFAGDDVYVGSGFFGTTHIDLRGNPTIVLD